MQAALLALRDRGHAVFAARAPAANRGDAREMESLETDVGIYSIAGLFAPEPAAQRHRVPPGAMLHRSRPVGRPRGSSERRFGAHGVRRSGA